MYGRRREETFGSVGGSGRLHCIPTLDNSVKDPKDFTVLSGTKNRTKLITFRLAPSEYERMRHACDEQGWRSISEFARVVVMHRVQVGITGRVSLGEDITSLGSSLEELEHSLSETCDQIRRVLGNRRPKDEAAAS